MDTSAKDEVNEPQPKPRVHRKALACMEEVLGYIADLEAERDKLRAERDKLMEFFPDEKIKARGKGDEWLVHITRNYGREVSRVEAIRLTLGFDPMPEPPAWLTKEWLQSTGDILLPGGGSRSMPRRKPSEGGDS